MLAMLTPSAVGYIESLPLAPEAMIDRDNVNQIQATLPQDVQIILYNYGARFRSIDLSDYFYRTLIEWLDLHALVNLVDLNLSGLHRLKDLDHLDQCKNLRFLWLSDCPALSTSSRQAVTAMTTLERIFLDGTNFSPEEIHRLAKNNPNLRAIGISNDRHLQALATEDQVQAQAMAATFRETERQDLAKSNRIRELLRNSNLSGRHYCKINSTDRDGNRVAILVQSRLGPRAMLSDRAVELLDAGEFAMPCMGDRRRWNRLGPDPTDVQMLVYHYGLNFTALDFKDCLYVEKFRSLNLRHCTHLTYLNLSGMKKLSTLVGLEACTALQILMAANCGTLSVLSRLAIVSLKGLQTADLTDTPFPSMEILSLIINNPGLRLLELGDIIRARAVLSLPDATSVRRIGTGANARYYIANWSGSVVWTRL